MLNPRSLLSAVAVVVAVGFSGALAARAQDHEHGAGHPKDGPATAALKLNQGKKWKTDDQLRGGMNTIRDELQKALDPIHAGTYSPEDYAALAGRIENQITNVLSKCKLAPDVDAQFHLVLADILAGTKVMKQDDNRMGGAVKIIKALEAYAKYFEHTGWKPIKH
ncbi:MAG: hypothetical protein HY904_24440 [Deltaproteobacteria bacterium]|nr:hypothetical protein [Deltaproteobacteria bacterium]